MLVDKFGGLQNLVLDSQGVHDNWLKEISKKMSSYSA